MSTGTGSPVDAFGEWQRLRGLSLATVKRRHTTLNQFVRYIHPLELVHVDQDLIEEWLGLFPHATTRAAYKSDLVAFYRWARKRHLIEADPTADLDTVKVPRGLPRPVDPDAIPDLVRYAPDHETRMAVALAAYAGLRVNEIARLTTDDLSLNGNPPILIVRAGKGNKDRVVPLHPFLASLLRDCPPGRICEHTTTTIGRKVTRHLADAGYVATTHCLRHSFGTQAAQVSGGNLLAVMSLMGHQSTETTQRYTAFASSTTFPIVNAMYQPAS